MFPIARLSFAAAVAVLSLGALGAFHPALAQQLDAGGLSALGAMPVGALVPYLTFAIAVATALLLVLPAPTATSSPIYAASFNLVHIIANLKTASAPAPAPAPAAAPGPSVPVAALMALMLGGMTLAACTAQEITQAEQIAAVGCKIDGVIQPIAVTLVTAVVPGGVGIATTDSLLVHPAVVKACDALNGQVVSAQIAPAAAAPAATAVTKP